MSNRLLSVIILVIIFSWIFGAYYYFFVANVWDLNLSFWSNSWITVELGWEFQNNYKNICNDSCSFKGIPPISYTLSISKQGFKPVQKNIKLVRWKPLNLSIKLQKLVYVEQINPTKIDKIDLLKFRKDSNGNDWDNKSNTGSVTIWIKDWIVYFYKFNPGFWLYSFKDWINKNILLLEDKIIKNVFFNKSDGLILINSKDWSNVFDLWSNTSYFISIKDDFIYAKKALKDEDKLLLKTKDSTYIYDLKTNTWIKNSVYNDYVLLWNDLVLWLINKSDKGKLSILNFSDNWKDKLILNNLSTRNRKIVFETDLNVKYIELIDNKIILTTSDWAQFEVKEMNY